MQSVITASRDIRNDCERLQEFYWRFNNYVALYELQEFKNCENPRNKYHKKRHKDSHALFHSQWKELYLPHYPSGHF